MAMYPVNFPHSIYESSYAEHPAGYEPHVTYMGKSIPQSEWLRIISGQGQQTQSPAQAPIQTLQSALPSIGEYGASMTNLYNEAEKRTTDIYGQTAGQARSDIETGYQTGVGDINKALEQLADIYDEADKLLKGYEVDAPKEVALIRGQLERSFMNDFLPQMQDLAQRGALPQGLISKRPYMKQMFESMIPLAGQQLQRARDINLQIGGQRAGLQGQYGQGVAGLYTNLAQLGQWKGGALANVEQYKGSGIAGAISQATSGKGTALGNILGSKTDLAKTMANLQAQLYEINKRYQPTYKPLSTTSSSGIQPQGMTSGMTWGGTYSNLQDLFAK